MSVAVADKPKRKFRRIKSGGELLKLVRETGTRGRAVDHVMALFRKDRYGNILPGRDGDVPAEAVVDRLREIREAEARGDWVTVRHWDGKETDDVPGTPISKLTMDKFEAIQRTGFWEAPAPPKDVELPVSDRLAAEEYDPEDDDDSDGGGTKLPVKRKAGRPPGARNKPVAAKEPSLPVEAQDEE